MFKKKKSDLVVAREQTENIAAEVNKKIDILGDNTGKLKDALESLQMVFDEIRGVPSEDELTLQELKKVRVAWIKQVEKIEEDYKAAEAKVAGGGAVGAGAGVVVAALGPTAAMGVATTFGVASTGTAISSLSGAAATNAALAWLGGGALAAGGGGMAAGNFFLVLAGPVGWAIAGVSLLSTGILLFKGRNDKRRLEQIFISISHRDTKSYQLAVVELNERIEKIKSETEILEKAVIESSQYGTDYDQMTEQQQVKLGTFVNLMNASTMLLVNPILGLQPKYTEEDYKSFISQFDDIEISGNEHVKSVISALSNLLYKIDMNDVDYKLLWKALRRNKEFRKAIDLSKKEFEYSLIKIVQNALNYQYSNNVGK